MQIYLPHRREHHSFLNQYSVDFDGTDEYLEIADHDDFSFTDGAGTDQPFSISAWINMDADPFRIVTKAGSATNYEYIFYVTGTGLLTINVSDSAGLGNFRGRQYSVALSTATWYHVVATYDGSEVNAGFTLYLDGSAVDDTNSSAGAYAGMNNGTATVKIGYWTSVDYANGKIDEVSFWDKELSGAEVTEIYNAGAPADLSIHSAAGNIISWYRMGDDPSDDLTGGTGTVIDQIGAHNATPRNTESGDKQTDVP